MDELSEAQTARWEQSTPRSDPPFWFTVGPQTVIGMVTMQEAPDIWRVACVGPNGIGVAIKQSGFTLQEAVEDAELTLRDLGWKLTDKGFR